LGGCGGVVVSRAVPRAPFVAPSGHPKSFGGLEIASAAAHDASSSCIETRVGLVAVMDAS
jgi:hypothetical protein